MSLSTSTTSSPSTATQSALTTSPVVTQPAGNQAALESASLCRAEGDDLSLQDEVIAAMLPELPLEAALCLASASPTEGACARFLSEVPLERVVEEAPAWLAEMLEPVLPDGVTYSLSMKGEVELEFGLGGGVTATLARVGGALQLTWRSEVEGSLDGGLSAESSAGSPFMKLAAEAKAKGTLMAGGYIQGQWRVGLGDARFGQLLGACARDLSHLQIGSLLADASSILGILAETVAPDAFAVGVVGSAGIEAGAGAQAGASVIGGAGAGIGTSAEAHVGWEGGYDAEGAYTMSSVGASGEASGSACAQIVTDLTARLGIGLQELKVQLGGDLAIRARPGAAEGSAAYELLLTSSRAAPQAGEQLPSLKQTETFAFSTLDELVGWVQGHLEVDDGALMEASWTDGAGLPAEELPDVGYERSFELGLPDLDVLAAVLPEALQAFALLVPNGADLSQVTDARVVGRVQVPVEAVRAVLGTGTLPTAGATPEAAVVGVERELAQAALVAAANGECVMEAGGRDVSDAAPFIDLDTVEVAAQLSFTFQAEVSETHVVGSTGVEGEVTGSIERRLPLDIASQQQLLDELAAA